MAVMKSPHKPATTPLIAGTVATKYDESHDVGPIARGRRAVVVDGRSKKSGVVVNAASLTGVLAFAGLAAYGAFKLTGTAKFSDMASATLGDIMHGVPAPGPQPAPGYIAKGPISAPGPQPAPGYVAKGPISAPGPQPAPDHVAKGPISAPGPQPAPGYVAKGPISAPGPQPMPPASPFNLTTDIMKVEEHHGMYGGHPPPDSDPHSVDGEVAPWRNRPHPDGHYLKEEVWHGTGWWKDHPEESHADWDVTYHGDEYIVHNDSRGIHYYDEADHPDASPHDHYHDVAGHYDGHWTSDHVWRNDLWWDHHPEESHAAWAMEPCDCKDPASLYSWCDTVLCGADEPIWGGHQNGHWTIDHAWHDEMWWIEHPEESREAWSMLPCDCKDPNALWSMCDTMPCAANEPIFTGISTSPGYPELNCETVCEGHGLTLDVCNAKQGCYFDGGQCWSVVGANRCDYWG